jgi:hypothetical protein
MPEVTDGDVLPEAQLKIAATGGNHQTPFDGWGPNDLSIDKTLDVFKNRIPFVASLGDGGVRLRSQQESVRAIDPGEPQFTHRMRYRTLIALRENSGARELRDDWLRHRGWHVSLLAGLFGAVYLSVGECEEQIYTAGDGGVSERLNPMI